MQNIFSHSQGYFQEKAVGQGETKYTQFNLLKCSKRKGEKESEDRRRYAQGRT